MAERQPLKNNGKQKGRRRPVKGLSGTTKRLLALILTVTLFCGAVAVVAYRDRFNLDALKRYMTYRRGRQRSSPIPGMPAMRSPASTALWFCVQIRRCSYIPTAVCCILIDR